MTQMLEQTTGASGQIPPQGLRYPITAAQFIAMVDGGILPRDGRFELIEGVIHTMPQMNKPHRRSIARLNKALFLALSDRVEVIPQVPVDMHSQINLPLPDFVVIASSRYQNNDFVAEDVTALIEISDTTLAYDRKTKLALYARERVPEYWIVDVNTHRLEVYRQPEGEEYRSKTTLERGQSAAFAEFPDAPLEWWLEDAD